MSDTLQVQDEILQMLYWMRGEGIGERVTLQQLNRFLGVGVVQLAAPVERLIERGFVLGGGATLQLTEHGIDEGKRRFLDEFSNYLGHETHISCDDPDCDCGRMEGEPCNLKA